MDGWMDRWMAGWMDRWMAGWLANRSIQKKQFKTGKDKRGVKKGARKKDKKGVIQF